jgi:DNA gyrase/topoisomerase IV subunit B
VVTKYTSDSIQTQEFPENIRRSPAMYIGGTDAHGLFVILRELLDNAVDEHLSGRNDRVSVAFDEDRSIWVSDNGHGIPQGIKKMSVSVNGKNVVSSVPVFQQVFGVLHTSGKFKSDAYAVSIGSHGVGVKGTNATSEFFDVVTCYEGKWYSIGFKKGKLTSPVAPCKAPKDPATGKPLAKGTLIHYKPDASIFTVKSFPPSMLMEWSEVMAYLNPGFKISISAKGKTKTFFTKEGPKDYIRKRLELAKAEAEPDMFEFSNELATVVVAFSNVDGFELKGYTNGLTNSQGGKHVDAVASGLYKALQPHKGTKQEFTSHDFRDGLIGIVNAKLHKAQFSSQDKAKLTDPRMGSDFEKLMEDAAAKFFNSNKAMAKRLCERASKINELKTKFKASKAVATELNKVKRQGLPPNYAPPHKTVPVKDRVLLVCEGDSAAGGLKKVREPRHGILPLKGKILNVARTQGDRALLSKEVLNILAAIGFDPKHEDPLKKLTVGSIVLFADADPDGPLVGSTKVKLLDGTTASMKKLAARWKKDPTPIWVWGVKPDGTPVPTQALSPRVVGHHSTLYEVKLDDGTRFRCTSNHKWAMNYAQHTLGSKHEYVHLVKTKDLSVGDSVVSIPFSTAGRKSRRYTTLEVEGKMVMAHQHVKKITQPKRFTAYKKANKGSGYGGAVHIHHLNDNPLDNTPGNLQFIAMEDHGRTHFREYSSKYNGSEKHLADLAAYFEANPSAREQARGQITAYNKSDKHRKTVAAQNRDPSQIKLQSIGKHSAYYQSLLDHGLSVKTEWDRRRPQGVQTLENLQYTFEELGDHAAARRYEGASKPRVNKKASYPTQRVTKFLRTCFAVWEHAGVLDSTTYSRLRKAWIDDKSIPQGTPKWETVFPVLNCTLKGLLKLAKRESTNHKIVSITPIEYDQPEPVYCLSVPETGNFLLEDRDGNGVASGNCHINALLHALISRYLPGLYEQGMVYVADMPEFYAIKGTQLFTGSKLSEVQAKLAKAKLKADVLHAKGWGEVDPEVLKILALDDRSAKRIRINPITEAQRLQYLAFMRGSDEEAQDQAGE